MKEVMKFLWLKNYFYTPVDSTVSENLWEFFFKYFNKNLLISSVSSCFLTLFLCNVLKPTFFETQDYEYQIYLSQSPRLPSNSNQHKGVST